jgi:aminoglycoside phosphotransferase (APT) family kinase protein
MASHPLPTPRLLRWDPDGEDLGIPFFVSEFIHGEPLLAAMKAGASWADDLYIETVCAVQSIRKADLPDDAVATMDGSESADAVLAAAWAMYEKPNDLAEKAYECLMATRPDLPADRFSNGDLWPENLLVQDRELVGIIDWQHAGFGDPIYEFLLPFFLVPEVRGRGTEESYCRRMGFDADLLDWYHGLEFFDALRWVIKLQEPYMIHTEESLTRDLDAWIEAHCASSER